MPGNTHISPIIQEQHKAIQQTIHELQELSQQATQAQHTDYSEEFNALNGVCHAFLSTHETMHLYLTPDLIPYYAANLKAIKTRIEAIESKPRSWSACETTGEQALYFIHALEGLIRSFLNILSFGHVNADNHADYFFHTPHHEKPEIQTFENLLDNLNTHIAVMKQACFPAPDGTPAPSE